MLPHFSKDQFDVAWEAMATRCLFLGGPLQEPSSWFSNVKLVFKRNKRHRSAVNLMGIPGEVCRSAYMKRWLPPKCPVYGHTTFSFRNLPCFVWMNSCLVLLKNSGAEFKILTGMRKEKLTTPQRNTGLNKLKLIVQLLLFDYHRSGFRIAFSAKRS